ncbi:MAG: hypothetical protein WDN04_14555 [Rhodospirillales bacterium]
MNFASDNTAPASPEILAALSAVNVGGLASYGADSITARVQARLAEIFGRPLVAYPASHRNRGERAGTGDAGAAVRRRRLSRGSPYRGPTNAARRSSIPAVPSW